MPSPINISASRGAAILGLSNWQTQISVWLQIMESREPGFCQKHNYELPVIEYSPAMRWGHAFESAIIELAEKRQETEIIDREKLYYAEYKHRKMKKIISCYIDGKYEDGCMPDFAGHKDYFLHEGKTTSSFYYKDHFGEPGTDKVPVEYQIQCQHQMICTGAEKVILSVLVFPRRVEEWEEMGYIVKNWLKENGESAGWIIENKGIEGWINPSHWAMILDQMGYFHQYEINADPELHKMMIEHYTEFWQKNVIKKIMPEPKSYDDIKRICREPVGTIIADENIERLTSEYKNIKSEISTSGNLGKRAEMLKVEILDFMRNHGADAIDKDSTDKWILRDRAGRKIASYGKTAKGSYIFR